MKKEKRSLLLNFIFVILTLFTTSNWRANKFLDKKFK